MIRLLALDIDGTLLDSNGVLPEANRRAIADAIGCGVEVALATGRRYDFARSIFEQLPSPLTLILSNGAVVKTCGGETLQRRLLPREVAHDVLRRTPEHRESAAVVFDRPREGQVVFEAIDWEHPRHSRFFASNRPFLAESKPLEDCLSEDPVQVMFSGGCSSMHDTLRTPEALLGRTVLGRADGISASRLLARGRDPSGGEQGNRSAGVGHIPRLCARGGHGDRRQPQRRRDAGVRRHSRSSWATPLPT